MLDRKISLKNGWLQFSLRTLLLLLTIVSIWLGFRVSAARRQREAVDAIVALGGTAFYDYQLKRSKLGEPGDGFYIDPKALSPHTGWFRPVAEQLFPPRVVDVRLDGTGAGDADLQVIKHLQRLDQLNLGGTNVTDSGLQILKTQPTLRSLNLSRTRITDDGLAVVGTLRGLRTLTLIDTQIGDRGLTHLKPLHLERLSLWKTNVGDEGVRHLRDMTTLQVLILDETRITDAALEYVGGLTNLEEWLGLTDTHVTDDGLVHLTRLNKLKNLNLLRTDVSSDGLRPLRKVLPKTNISPM